MSGVVGKNEDEAKDSMTAKSHRARGDGPAFYTAAETAEILRLDESTLYRHLRSGAFPGLKIGGRYVVPGAVIQRLVDDVLATGRCVDLGEWTTEWRGDQVAALARLAAKDVELPGGAA